MKKENYKSNNPCTACLIEGEDMVCFHHIQTRGSGGSDSDENLIPVCQRCHNEFHSKGTVFMSEKYKNVKSWLSDNNWYFCKLTNKYRRNEND